MAPVRIRWRFCSPTRRPPGSQRPKRLLRRLFCKSLFSLFVFKSYSPGLFIKTFSFGFTSFNRLRISISCSA